MKTFLSQVALIAILLPGLGAANHLAARPNVAGTWQFSVDLDEGSHGDPIFVFRQEGDKLTGTYDGPLGHQEVTGTVTGTKPCLGFKHLGTARRSRLPTRQRSRARPRCLVP